MYVYIDRDKSESEVKRKRLAVLLVRPFQIMLWLVFSFSPLCDCYWLIKWKLPLRSTSI